MSWLEGRQLRSQGRKTTPGFWAWFKAGGVRRRWVKHALGERVARNAVVPLMLTEKGKRANLQNEIGDGSNAGSTLDAVRVQIESTEPKEVRCFRSTALHLA